MSDGLVCWFRSMTGAVVMEGAWSFAGRNIFRAAPGAIQTAAADGFKAGWMLDAWHGPESVWMEGAGLRRAMFDFPGLVVGAPRAMVTDGF